MYELIKDKYIADFAELGADELFQKAIFCLQRSFADSLPLLKEMLSEKIHDQISSLNANTPVSIEQLDNIFTQAISLAFE